MNNKETPDLVIRMIGWIIQRVGARRLAGGALLGTLLITAAVGLEQVGRGMNGVQLALTACTAALMGWAAAHAAGKGSQLTLVALFLAGVAWIILIPGGLLEPAAQTTVAGLEWLAASIRQPTPTSSPDPTAVRVLWVDLSVRLIDLFGRLSTWAGGALTGKAAYDQLAAQTIWSALMFACGGWAGWALRRGVHPLWSALPTTGLLATGLSFVGGGTLYLFPVLASTIGLMAWNGYHKASIEWERRQVDIAEGLAFDLGMWGLGLALGVAALALPLSKPAPQKLAQAVQELTGPRTESVQSFGESLGLESHPQTAGTLTGGGSLPRQHLLGAGPEITERLAFEVEWPREYSAPLNISSLPAQVGQDEMNIPPMLSRPYWRGATYDVYTGRGWATSAVVSRDYRPGEALPATLSGRRKMVEAAFRFPSSPANRLPGSDVQRSGSETEGTARQIYVPGEPITLDQSFHTETRPAPEANPGSALRNNDLYTLTLLRTGNRYRIRTEIRLTGEAELRTALTPPPAWIAERYLALTPGLPSRVVLLAERLAVGRTTPYEKALAIENYLRQLPYSLDVPEPPPGRDAVDYFLFDLRTGYCDYYASAMVVLARLNGLPARLAIGYATGIYDQSRGSFLVTEGEAHSWPEIYFSGIGWVIFEPTSSRPALERPQKAEVPLLPQAEAGSEAESDWSLPLLPWETAWGTWLLLFTALATAAVGLWIGLPRIEALRLHRIEPAVAMEIIYRNMRQAALPEIHHSAGRKSRKIRELTAETPFEFASGLESRLAGLITSGSIKQWMAPTAELAWQIVRRYSRAAYSPYPPGQVDVDLTLNEWRQLKPRLWWLRIKCGMLTSLRRKHPISNVDRAY